MTEDAALARYVRERYGEGEIAEAFWSELKQFWGGKFPIEPPVRDGIEPDVVRSHR